MSRHTLTTSSSFCGGACVLFRPRSAAHDCGRSPAADKKGEKGEKGALPPVGTIGPQQFVIKLKQENVMFEVRQPNLQRHVHTRARNPALRIGWRTGLNRECAQGFTQQDAHEFFNYGKPSKPQLAPAASPCCRPCILHRSASEPPR